MRNILADASDCGLLIDEGAIGNLDGTISIRVVLPRYAMDVTYGTATGELRPRHRGYEGLLRAIVEILDGDRGRMMEAIARSLAVTVHEMTPGSTLDAGKEMVTFSGRGVLVSQHTTGSGEPVVEAELFFEDESRGTAAMVSYPDISREDFMSATAQFLLHERVPHE